jgi:ribulose-phosphate 3-epimerase
MLEIIPAIMPRNYEDLKNRVALVRGIVPLVQIDICDGIFVKNQTWPYDEKDNDISNFNLIMEEKEGMPFWEDIDFELDLMVVDAVENFPIYMKLGPKRIVFHIEAIGNFSEFKDFLEGLDTYIRDTVQIGIAINTKTNIENIFPLVNYVDFIQCMGIEHIGFQGEGFDEKVLEHIKTLKEKYPDVIIAVDGSVNFDTAPDLIDAGAERLVIGSAIFKSNDIKETVDMFESLE